ncbi:hypothetical protein BGZ72_010064 [Mortierella alpina]|nr:hypothetical protein BGZ72_010064 [Mortierella alpina]
MPFCDAEGWHVFSQRRDMDFTQCFQDSVLTIVPSIVLLIAFSPRLHKVAGKGRLLNAKANATFYIKMLAVAAAIAIQLGLLIKTVQQEEYLSSSLLSTILYLVALASAAFLHWFEFFNMPNPSTTLIVFWLCTALLSIFPTRSLIQESPDGLSSTTPALKLAFSVVAFLVLVLENIPKPQRKTLLRPNVTPPVQDNPSPEPRANFFKRITFFWLLPLLLKGKKKALRMDDVWSLHPKLLSYPLYLTTKAKMDAHEALMAHQLKEEEAAATAAGKDAGDEKHKRITKLGRSKINLAKVVMGTVGYSIMTAIIPRLFYIAALYVRPALFSGLINFTQSYSPGEKAKGTVPQEPWLGYGLLIGVFASAILSSLFDAQYINICFNCGLKARGVLVNLIYRKSLRLSTTNKQEGMGAIVNHMSTDVDKVVATFLIFHYSWSSIVEIIIASWMLYNEVRYAMFASLMVIVIILGISGGVSPKIGFHQKAMMKFSDQRMKLINELVTYIKSIKLYTWESYFTKKITYIRSLQLRELRMFYGWITLLSTFLNMVGPFSIFATLAVYTLIATTDAPLDIDRIFTSINLIHMLEGPVGLINQSLSTIVGGKVAYDRLQHFFNSEEIDDENVIRSDDKDASEFAYEIDQGTFGWYTPEAIEATVEKKEKEVAAKAAQEAKAAKNNKKTAVQSVGQPDESSSTLDEKLDKIKTATEESDVSTTEEGTPNMTRDSMGPIMHNINLRIKRGNLTAVVGRVGEGKSSLVGALLGEMHRYSGTVRSYGSLAYVAQSAWILNDSVKNNILFGKPYDKERYINVIKSCALVPDFKMLIHGDSTVIGEKGISLSGGQKQRISIARAVYADADVYIFDDPLSAVDAHVDKHIFEHALTKILAGKTRILVTNGVNHLAKADQIVVIRQGTISQDGCYSDLIQDEQGDLYRLIQESKFVATKDDSSEHEEDLDGEIDSVTEGSDNDNDSGAQRPEGPVKRPTYRRAKSTAVDDEAFEVDEKNEINDEVKSEGRVGWDVYKFYLLKLGSFGLIRFGMIAVVYLAVDINMQLWLKNWGNQVYVPVEEQHPTSFWILTYLGFVIAMGILLALTIANFMVFMARKASKGLHAAMLGPLARSPMSFFDVTSSGKIVNRFAHDMTAVDIDLPLHFLNLIFISLMACTTFAFCIAASPYFAIIMVPVGYMYSVLGGFYLVSSRELKRLDSAARSPIYAHFGETLSGLVTLRAFGETNRFSSQATILLDRSQQTSYLTNATTRWLQIMLDMVSVMIMSLVALLAIVQRDTVNQGIFAIVLSQISSLTLIMTRIMTTACQIETDIVSIERVREYSQLPSEARDIIPDSKTDENWPQQGEVAFKNYSARYRDGLDLVLRDLSVTVKGGERVGIVGRTGAGKSSVTMALFRIIEAAEGSISIDGIDISTLGLTELRSRLTIIPQDPFLFGDSIRSNLDPFGRHTDTEIWAAIESASLKPYISSLSEGLSTMIDNGGENMSLGQRQLMSLARAMLAKNTRVLCLDEATAAIDVETDNAIQQALRREFQGCTVLTIAHRINTIMDSDRIMVLDNGGLKEFESPEKLLANTNSIFYSLAKESGNV